MKKGKMTKEEIAQIWNAQAKIWPETPHKTYSRAAVGTMLRTIKNHKAADPNCPDLPRMRRELERLRGLPKKTKAQRKKEKEILDFLFGA